MSKDNDPPNPLEDLQKQIQEMLRRGQIPNPFGPQAGGPGVSASGAPPAQNETADDEESERDAVLRRIRDFSLRPREIRDYLDRFVIRQDEAKKVISVAICDHYNHVRRCLEDARLREKEYAKQNIILLGPTGVGKTYLMRCVAKLVGVPFVKADATKFSETGYVGGDVEDLVRELVRLADNDVELAQYGIIYIDEIDKIAAAGSAGTGGRDVSGRGVQINLLKLMEETEVSLHSQTDLLGQMQAMMEMQRSGKARRRTINTRHILFIVSGAFDKLPEQVRRRLMSSRLGFGATGGGSEVEDAELLTRVQSSDFIDYGFEPEFIGRLPVRVACRPLDADDLESILLQAEGSILNQYRADFTGYGIDFSIDRAAISEVARRAYEEKTGARGLMTVLERLLRDFKFELPSTSIKSFSLDARIMEDPRGAVRELLKANASSQREVLRKEVESFAERFHSQHNFRLDFDEAAVEALIEESLRRDKTIRGLCEEKFHDFHHGLTLIHRQRQQDRFAISAAVIANPDQELSKWVMESFKDLREGGAD
ncbi:MAG: AAA family ATPase [Puniceicoccaceae bacterium]|nr:MAG: AAA family ATPase [Puniceicoccaceae bacterium]